MGDRWSSGRVVWWSLGLLVWLSVGLLVFWSPVCAQDPVGGAHATLAAATARAQGRQEALAATSAAISGEATRQALSIQATSAAAAVEATRQADEQRRVDGLATRQAEATAQALGVQATQAAIWAMSTSAAVAAEATRMAHGQSWSATATAVALDQEGRRVQVVAGWGLVLVVAVVVVLGAAWWWARGRVYRAVAQVDVVEGTFSEVLALPAGDVPGVEFDTDLEAFEEWLDG